jgi:hypothetical protein
MQPHQVLVPPLVRAHLGRMLNAQCERFVKRAGGIGHDALYAPAGLVPLETPPHVAGVVADWWWCRRSRNIRQPAKEGSRGRLTPKGFDNEAGGSRKRTPGEKGP